VAAVGLAATGDASRRGQELDLGIGDREQGRQVAP
jgi:hypothetical protein